MGDYFAIDGLPGLLLGLLAMELLVLLLLWRLRGLGVPPAPLVAFLGSGACLTMALRAALTGQGTWVAPWLAAALPLHLAWQALAWRRRQGDATYPTLLGGTHRLRTPTGPRPRATNMTSSRTDEP